jgi:hypothetical protein
LAVLANKNVGYLYDGPIIKEGKKLTSDVESSEVV